MSIQSKSSSVIPEKVRKSVESWLSKRENRPLKWQLLAGDGSVRAFWRVRGPSQKSYIALSDPQWENSADYAPIQKFLENCQLPVPTFYFNDPDCGCILMDDLGDELLQTRLGHTPSQTLALLGKAVSLLAGLQSQTYPVPDSLPVFHRHFDAAKYEWELRFTWEHLGEKYLKSKPTLAAKDEKELQAFCQRLEPIGPKVFAHRDYHARNLLWQQEKLYLIDFQDARMGPPHYDLASLLFDPYVTLSESQRKLLLEGYQKEIQATSLGKQIDWEPFQRQLYWVGAQRLLKAAGSFASFLTRYGKSTHLAYLVPCLETVAWLYSQDSQLATLSTIFPVTQWLESLDENGNLKN